MKIDVQTDRAEVVIHALVDIPEGEEITISYLPMSSMKKQERQEFLSSVYKFTCTCAACCS